MNSQQVQDMRLMYEAVYNDELWELANEYNNTIYDEDIVEVATEYFYTYGLNEDGIDILIEKVGLDNFVEFVYDLSEDLILTEARKVSKAKKQPGSLRSRQQEKLAAQRAAAERTETEKKEPESKGADTEAKAEQPKKKPVRDAIARNIFRAVGAYNAGMERHSQATQTAGRLAGETGRTLGRIASFAGEAGRRGVEHVKKHGMKSLANEETEIGITGKKIPKPRTAKQQYELEKNRRKRKHLGKNVGGTQYSSDVNPYLNPRSVREKVETWVNSLIEEGYDLSEYTWDDMCEMYMNLDEGNRGENVTRMSNVSKLNRRQKKFAAGIVHPDEAGELEGERQKAHRSGRYVPTRGSGVREGYDTFDAILEHLIAEGYADTNESALAIMANMSEEWREEILDEATIRSVTSSSGKRIYKSPEYSSDERTNISKTAHRQKRLKQRHYASTSDARDDQRSFDHEERQENKRRKHPTNIMNAKPGEAEHYGADEGDGYHYDTVKTDRNARKRRASGR